MLASSEKPELKEMVQKIDEKRFVKIEKSIFKSTIVDTGTTIQKI